VQYIKYKKKITKHSDIQKNKSRIAKQDCALLPLPSLLRLSISWKRRKAIDQYA
jgi:hypothetical protein